MDELIRSTIHDALEVPEPAGLRSRVIAAVPMERRSTRRWHIPVPGLQRATAFAAIVLTAALIAALVSSRIGPLPAKNHPHGTNLRLSAPKGVAVSSDGTVYVSDYVDNRVFRIQPDGTLATVAGGGLMYEGPATKANLLGPVALTVASNGDLFIASNPGTSISRVDPAGHLSTVFSWHSAGSALEPWGVAISPSGLLYTTVGGMVETIRPDGSTSPIELSGVPSPVAWPGNLAFDSDGNLYVADMAPVTSSIQQVPPPPGGCRILRIAPDNSVSVIAGTGKCGYSGDGGPAVNAQLNDPQGIALDRAGNLYFADSHNHRIRRIDAHGVITTVAGTGIEGDTGDRGAAIEAELAYLGGVAISQGRFLYFTETETASGAYGAVRVIDLQKGTIDTVVSTRSKVVS